MRQAQTIYGIDFSGAKDAGNKIWLAKGASEDGGLVIEECLRVRDLRNSGKDIKVCMAGIVDLVKSNPSAIFGFDFPFGLPHSLVTESTWEEWVLAFPGKYESPEAFRMRCRVTCKGRELKRETDRESRTPFSSYNLRIYKQTYFGVSSVLSPLVRGDHARVLPMQKRKEGKAVILEICPASTLKASGPYVPYKGKSAAHRAARQSILERLPVSRPFSIGNGDVREKAIEDAGGDALDSIVAAAAAFHAMKDGFTPHKAKRNFYALEGYVYV